MMRFADFAARLFAVCGLAALALGNSAAWAADSAAPAATKNSADDLAAKRADLAQRMAKLAPAEKSEDAESPSLGESRPAQTPAEEQAADEAEEELDRLRSLDMVYLQHQAALQQQTELAQDKKSIAEAHAALENFGPSQKKPYSFLLYEDLRDQLAAEEDRRTGVDSDLASSQQMLQTAREALDECERERRLAKEELDHNEETEKQHELASALRLAELESTIAQASVELRRVEIEVMTARRELGETRTSFLKANVERIAKDVHFTEHDFEARQAALGRLRKDFRAKLKEAERLLRQHEAQLVQVLAKLELEHADKRFAVAAGEAYQMARHVHHEEITLLNQRLRELEQLKHFLGCRHEIASAHPAPEELKEWHTRIVETVEQFKQGEHSLMLRLEEIRVDQATLYRRQYQAADEDARLRPWIDLAREQLQRLSDLCDTSLLHLKSSRRTLERFQEDLATLTHTESGPNWVTASVEACIGFWNYEFASVNDRPITVGKIISGLVYLVLGVLVARTLSRLLARYILPRVGLNEGAVHAVQAISFYGMCVLFSLLSLELVNLPFAAFTFLGGAVAIAFGFGSQNILNNFISGLILLAEQPIRVGDLVELEGVRGTVEHIGARSTRVKTLANHEIIVPNSILLENKVTNLTLSDDLVRTAIGVTLAPMLPVAEVSLRLYEAAVHHPKVMNEPEPVVLFLSFSETQLSFELHFWLRLHDVMEGRVVESEVREAISISLRDTNAATTAVAASLTAKVETKSAKDVVSVKMATEKVAMEKIAMEKVALEKASERRLREAG